MLGRFALRSAMYGMAASPKISIKDSSEPFRAFLGAILSVPKGAHIEPSTFNPDMQLHTIIEDTDEGPPEDDTGDISVFG